MNNFIGANQCTVNILLATYNGEKYIEKQLQSIVEQTYQNWNLYIHDDGSSDSTLQIINRVIQTYPACKITLLKDHVKGLGACGNFSYLLQACTPADFCFFCDQDDIWQKNKIAYMVRFAGDYDADIPLLFFHDMQIIDRADRVISPSLYDFSHIRFSKRHPFQQLLTHNSISGCAMMINHTLQNRLGIIPEDCIIYDWWIALAAFMTGGEILHVEKMLSGYRIHENNTMGLHNTLSASWIRNAIRDKHYKRYHNNNILYKRMLLNQIDQLMLRYADYIDNNTNQAVRQFWELLEDRKRLRVLYKAYRMGYTLTNHLETLKFYLL